MKLTFNKTKTQKISKPKFTTGFSLLELVLAIAIFSLSSVAIATLLIDSNVSTRLGSERMQALLYVKEGIEAARSIRDNNWVDLTDGNHGLNNSGTIWVFSGESDLLDDKYTRVVNVSTESTSTKLVSSTVSWDLTTARTSSVVLNTIFTDWKIIATSTGTTTATTTP